MGNRISGNPGVYSPPVRKTLAVVIDTRTQTYVFMCDLKNFDHALRQVGRYAADPEHPEFTWLLAARAARGLRKSRVEALMDG